jgi:hypothetical protein
MSSTDQPAVLARPGRPGARGQRTDAERYRGGKPSVRRARDRAQAPHPLEYDASGFPLEQRTASFVERVARLRNPL